MLHSAILQQAPPSVATLNQSVTALARFCTHRTSKYAFPAVITAKSVAKIAKASEKLEQPLNSAEGVDYRLSGEPTQYEGTDELPPAAIAYYKPIVLRNSISF